jgi:TP901 family phage tail tape measure protein
MASLGDLVVNLVANSQGMATGLKQAEGYLTAFASAATAFAAASVARFVQVGSAFDDMAQRTGVAVEALSTLSYAAKLSDTSIEAVQGGLMKMAKFMGDLRGGSDEAAKKLQALGISATQILAANPEQQFKIFADAIAGIEDPSERAAAAMEIFGKGAGELLPLLQQGGQGIEALQEQGREFGAYMSTEVAQSAAQLGDGIDNLTTAFTGLAVQVGYVLSKALVPLLNTVAKLVAEYSDFFAAIAVTAAAVGGVVLAMKAVTLATQAYAKAQAVALALSSPKGWIILAAGLAAAAFATSALTSEFEAQNAESERLQKNLAQQANAAKNLPKPQQGKSDLDVRSDRMTEFQKSLDAINTQSAEGQAEALRRKLAQLSDDFYVLNKNSRTNLTPEQFAEYRQAAIDAFTGVGEKTKELQQELSILRGETTAQEIEFQRMLSAGASNAQIEALRQMQAERDKLLAQQEEEAKRQADITAAAEQSKAALEAEVDAIKESLKTPEQKLDERLKRINELGKSGQLNVMEVALAQSQIQKERDALKQQNAPTAINAEPRFAGAAMRGSGEAFSTILRSMGRKDPNVAATEKQTKDLVAAMAKNKPEFQVAEV